MSSHFSMTPHKLSWRNNSTTLVFTWSQEILSYYQRKKLSQAHKKRAAIEPVIGHVKTDHRLNRNFYKGIVGDNMNIMIAAAGFNFKRMMNKWKSSFELFFQKLYCFIWSNYFTQYSPNLTF